MMFDLLLLIGLLVAIAVVLAVVLRQDRRLKQAENKGMNLLLANLSAQQREQYQAFGYFEVIGSDTHRRYRIFKGRFANVRELSLDDRPDIGRCFYPEGGLVAGDCMLAQKIALENCELATCCPAVLLPLKLERTLQAYFEQCGTGFSGAVRSPVASKDWSSSGLTIFGYTGRRRASAEEVESRFDDASRAALQLAAQKDAMTLPGYTGKTSCE